MFTKVRQILGKLFLSSASFFWFGCTDTNSDIPVGPFNIANQNSSSGEAFSSSETPANSSSSAEAPKNSAPFIDIEQELAKLTPLDTTGLRGKCVSEKVHCETIENFNGSINYENNVITIAKTKFNSLINSEQNVPFSDWKKRCYENAIGNGSYPIYGVSLCSDSNRERKFDESCETEESVHIDEAYLKALQKNDSLKRYVYQKKLEQINEKVAECDAVE